MERVIESYDTSGTLRERERERESKTLPLFSTSTNKGVPIGNLTSQIFANIYMSEFDQFVKHELRVKNYARYTDDFVIISENKIYLEELLPKLQYFLFERLKLELHPKKVTTREYHNGIDFLGYVIFPHFRLLRSKTKRRVLRNIISRIKAFQSGQISEDNLRSSLQSYFGVLSHANAYELTESLKNQVWYWMKE